MWTTEGEEKEKETKAERQQLKVKTSLGMLCLRMEALLIY